MEATEEPRSTSSSRALRRAVMAGRVAVVKWLLWAGVGVNGRDRRWRTPLHWACESLSDRSRVIDLLVRWGADVDAQDMWGNTPLHNATQNINRSAVVTLLDGGARTDLVSCEGRTPLHDVAEIIENHTTISIAKVLLEHNPAGGSEERGPQHLLTHHLDCRNSLNLVNVQDYKGNTALHLASKRGNKEVVSLLLRSGAKLEVRDGGGKTALHWASGSSAKGVVDILLDNGGNLNAKDVFGNTPLHLACTNDRNTLLATSRVGTIEILLSRGAKVDERNSRGETAYEKLHSGQGSNHSHILGIPYTCNDIMNIEKAFIKHVVLLRTLNLMDEFNVQWKLGREFYNEISAFCCQELEAMKSVKVVNDMSLYKVLSHINKPYLLSSGDLCRIDKFLSSPDFLTRFPLYGETLRIAFQRRKVLTLAVLSFYTERRKLMVKELPLEVVEQLLTYLTIADIRCFIQSMRFHH